MKMFVCFASLVVDDKKQTVRRREILELFFGFHRHLVQQYESLFRVKRIKKFLLEINCWYASVHAKLESRNAQTTGSVSLDDLTQCMLENNAYSLVGFTRA